MRRFTAYWCAAEIMDELDKLLSQTDAVGAKLKNTLDQINRDNEKFKQKEGVSAQTLEGDLISICVFSRTTRGHKCASTCIRPTFANSTP